MSAGVTRHEVGIDLIDVDRIVAVLGRIYPTAFASGS